VSTANDDDLWSAVGDPTRRRILDLLLADGVGTSTTLSERLPVTRQAVAKHLGVLDRVGLVHVTPAGRERRYEVDEAQLTRAVVQLTAVGSTWDARLQRIKRIAERIQRSKQGCAATYVAATSDRTLKRARTPGSRRRGNEMVDILHRLRRGWSRPARDGPCRARSGSAPGTRSRNHSINGHEETRI